ncbi:MAG: hypothetical protein AAGA64_13040 [Bacteroidota bacterium]
MKTIRNLAIGLVFTTALLTGYNDPNSDALEETLNSECCEEGGDPIGDPPPSVND